MPNRGTFSKVTGGIQKPIRMRSCDVSARWAVGRCDTIPTDTSRVLKSRANNARRRARLFIYIHTVRAFSVCATANSQPRPPRADRASGSIRRLSLFVPRFPARELTFVARQFRIAFCEVYVWRWDDEARIAEGGVSRFGERPRRQDEIFASKNFFKASRSRRRDAGVLGILNVYRLELTP
jgi:hypothetical protein